MICVACRSEWSYLNGYCLRSGDDFELEMEGVEYCRCQADGDPACSPDLDAAPCQPSSAALTDGTAALWARCCVWLVVCLWGTLLCLAGGVPVGHVAVFGWWCACGAAVCLTGVPVGHTAVFG